MAGNDGTGIGAGRKVVGCRSFAEYLHESTGVVQ